MTGVLLITALAGVGCAVSWRLTRTVRTGLPGCPWNPRRSMRGAAVAFSVGFASFALPGELWLTLPVAFTLLLFGFARLFFTLIDLVMFPAGKDRVLPAARRPTSVAAYRMAQLESTGVISEQVRTS